MSVEVEALAVEATGVSVRFRRVVALDDVDLRVRPGSVTALLGQNGAGKTTLINTLVGYRKPDAGTVRVVGLDPAAEPLQVRRRVGYVGDQPALYDWMRIDEIGSFTAAFYDDGFFDAYRRLIAGYGLAADAKVGELSRGQRAKVALALAVAPDPPLLILDEPTGGLDPRVRREFLESMIDRAAAGRAVLLSSHHIDEVERVADEVVIIDRGRVKLAGALEALKSSVTRLTIRLDDPLVSLPAVGEDATPLSEDTRGRVRRVVGIGLEDYADAVARTAGVDDVTHDRPSLEDVFLAVTSEADAPAAVGAGS